MEDHTTTTTCLHTNSEPANMFGSIRCYTTILLLCFSLLLLQYYYDSTTTATITTNQTDLLALLAIKSQLHDPLGVASSWNNSVNLCKWRGITCGRKHQRVTKLDLSNTSIGGPLSPYIGNLSFLRFIDLATNSFYGEIPLEIGRLFRLQTLALDNNSFSGTIPTNLSRCSNLIMLSANRNNLTGEIPTEIGYLLKLEILAMGRNYLTGQLPASIGNLSALRKIDLAENNLGGSIPDNLGQLGSLIHFTIAVNKFSGMIPPSIYNISSLEVFSILSNRFHGSLPPNIGFILPNLKAFRVDINNFTGNIPVSFSNASNLVRLSLSENYFSGKVSLDFIGLEKLSWLNLGVNNLGTGKSNDLHFINSLTNCSKLQLLYLLENQFGGVLPHTIANLSNTIIEIAIGSNQLRGTIPEGIANLVNLNVIGMEFNQLTGSIPHVIGELKNLQTLFLDTNKFQGSIPVSLGNLTLLGNLDLAENNLQGNIPSSLGNCQNLNWLSLAQNKLTGFVPQQVLTITTLSVYLDLSNNYLSGLFPSAVGNLKNLIKLDISRNYFSGEIPVTLGGCTSLEYLHMQYNYFDGSLSSSLSSLKSIKVIDLSHNNLSGQIPQYFENLSFLEYLNLSYNHFEGKIPTKGVFSNSTRVSLIGNEKLCADLDELHFPSCHSKRLKTPNFTLLKVLIPAVIASLVLLVCFLVVFTQRRKSSPKSVGMLQTEGQFPMITYAELNKTTNEFSSSNIIGKGSCGVVYKGNLSENGMLIAVKVLNLEQKRASKSFMVECQALRNVRHRNLIKIITICSSIDFKGSDFKAIIYEFMQNGSLEELLHQRNDQLHTCNLSPLQRLNIAIDVASAIEYLHHHCQPPIVHGDLKPSNILLDHDMIARVSDFGLSEFLYDPSLGTTTETQSSSVGIKGTFGYMAPEHGMGGGVSLSADVYSFGIMLLEIFTGKKPTDQMFNDGLTLHELAKMALQEKVMEIVEPSLLLEVRGGDCASHINERVRLEDCLTSIVRIGVVCSVESPTERMKMADVVTRLCAIKRNFLNCAI